MAKGWRWFSLCQKSLRLLIDNFRVTCPMTHWELSLTVALSLDSRDQRLLNCLSCGIFESTRRKGVSCILKTTRSIAAWCFLKRATAYRSCQTCRSFCHLRFEVLGASVVSRTSFHQFHRHRCYCHIFAIWMASLRWAFSILLHRWLPLRRMLLNLCRCRSRPSRALRSCCCLQVVFIL